MPVHETNCIVKFSSWPTTGTTITNHGTAGSGYNGTAYDNDYTVLPSGATAFAFDTSDDLITIPHGTAINNFSLITLEFIFYVGRGVTTLDFAAKGDQWGITVNTDWGGYISISRYNNDWSGKVMYTFGSLGLVAGGWNDLQITWDCSGYSNVPILKLNNVARTMTANGSTGTVTAWLDDSAQNFTLWNLGNLSPASGVLALFRWHNAILSDAYLVDNFNNDWPLTETLLHATVGTSKYAGGTSQQYLNPPIVSYANAGTAAASFQGSCRHKTINESILYWLDYYNEPLSANL